MTKLFAAMVAAGLMIGAGSALARDTAGTGTSSGQDATSQERQNPGSEAPARRSIDSTQQGQTTPGPGAGKHPGDSADTSGSAVRSEESTGTANNPSNPGDPTDELRNRDSTKQQDPNMPPKQ